MAGVAFFRETTAATVVVTALFLDRLVEVDR